MLTFINRSDPRRAVRPKPAVVDCQPPERCYAPMAGLGISAFRCAPHELTQRGHSELSLLLRNCPLLEAPVVRWNILRSNNLNMRYGCIKRSGHELVMMQEGLEHVL